MRILSALLSATVFILPGHVLAQGDTPPPMPLEQQEQLEMLQKGLDAAHVLDKQIDTLTASKKNQCMKAFGNVEFCDCIAKKSPIGVDFYGLRVDSSEHEG